jgi:ATP-dependent RNA helicase RhlE
MDFNELGLLPRLVEAVEKQGLTEPTPIQAEAIPHGLAGRDVMGLAQTGTGKTAAFGLPLINALLKAQKPSKRCVGGLVLAPTRELARQISDNLFSYLRGSHLKVRLVVGGQSLNKQILSLSKGTDLLIATPGRLIDLLDRGAVRLDETRFLVLDEADQMLDMGFIHALRQIEPLLPAERQTMLFSATMPKHMAELSKAYLTDPVRVEVSPPGKTADKVRQSVHFVEQSAKFQLLKKLLLEGKREKSLVFGRTKHGCEKLMKGLVAAGVNAASIHGNKSQSQRDRAIKALKAGEIDVLVATDVAARGIDIPGIVTVYNYELPNVAENYVHRIGRTARAGASGQAISFCNPEEATYLRDIQKLIGLEIEVAGGTPWRGAEIKAPPKPGGKGQRGKPRHRRRPQSGKRRPDNSGGGDAPKRKRTRPKKKAKQQ